MKRTLRHPIRGDRLHPRPGSRQPKHGQWRNSARQPRMRPRKSVSVSSLVGSPEDEPSRPNVRMRVVGVVVLCLFGVLVLRLWTLQVIDAKSYAEAVTRNQVRVISVAAPRGQIVDRNDTVLVGNNTEEEILLSRSAVLVHPDIVGKVAALVGETPKTVRTAINNDQYSPYEPVPIAAPVPMATVLHLETDPSEYPGVTVQTVTQRTYPQGGTTAVHVLGYVGRISSAFLKANPHDGYTQGSQVGTTGIEQEYEKYLRGVNGRNALSVNASGNVVGTLSRTAAQLGDTVVLNVNTGLQLAVQNDLEQQIMTDRNTPDVEDGGAKPPAINGAAIVMDPQNGAVYAMASFPTYDNNEWVGGISNANYAALAATGAENNNAIQGQYTPGSTFKLATATAALQTGLISATTPYDDKGTFTVPGCASNAAADTGCVKHDDPGDSPGVYDVSSALTVSSDAFFYNLGAEFWDDQSRYGTTPIQNVAAQYGEGQITGIDLPNEVQGRVDSLAERTKLHDEAPKAFNPPSWFTGDNVEMAFGQGETVLTPIEQAVSYATFANGGTRYAPQVAAEIVNPTTGQVVKKLVPDVTGHVNLPSSVTQPILQGLEGVISDQAGTGYKDFEGFPASWNLAGKTGTASNQTGEEPNSWFVAFGPNPNPQYLVLAVIDQGGYGAEAAAPLVRNIFDYLLANPILPVKTPTATSPPSDNAPATNPPVGTPTTTTTTIPGTSSGGTTTTTSPGGG